MGFRDFCAHMRRDVLHIYHYSDEALANFAEVDRLIAEGYNPRSDLEPLFYEGDNEQSRIRSNNPILSGVDYGETKYRLVETPTYLRHRKSLENDGIDLFPLDYAIKTLLDGKKLDRKYRPHKLKGLGRKQECHIKGSPLGDDWVLIHQCRHRKLVLYELIRRKRGCGID